MGGRDRPAHRGRRHPLTTLTALTAAGICAGLAGTLFVVFPGIIVVWGSVLVWALVGDNPWRWWVLAVATLLLVASSVLKYVVPGRRLSESGVPGSTLAVAGIAGVVGFFVVPVVGFFAGFVLGLLACELVRLRELSVAWPATRSALVAVGLSVAIELFAGLVIAGTWTTAVVAA